VDVLEAAGTKWNFLPFRPGLVGGHCIGVDPYYLSYCAQQTGYEPEVILAGRKVNDGMGQFIADHVGRLAGPKARILVLGLTFKENVPDIRNSKVADIVHRLKSQGQSVTVADPMADSAEAEHEFGFPVERTLPAGPFDAVIGAVAHRDYAALEADELRALVREGGVIADVKGMWRNLQLPAGLRRWQL
jgi:UDP-N-acetyl-D-galactosamine dehydrogenase